MAWTTPGTAVAGDVLTAAFWNLQVRDNLDYLKTTADTTTASIKRLGQQTRTTNYTISATSIAAAADVFSSDLTFTADGTSTYVVEAYFGEVYTGAAAGDYVTCHLVDGSGNAIAQLATLAYGDGTRGSYGTWAFKFFYTPTSGSKSLNIRAIRSGTNNGGITLGTGTGGSFSPGVLSVYGPDVT